MAQRRVTPKEASRILSDLSDRLEASDELSEAYARAVLEQAQRNASLRPTPQAPMAAAGMGVQGNRILSLTGGDPAAVAAGSEFGSDIYLQFQKPHSSRGYWLLPAGENPDSATIAAGEEALDQEIEAAVRGF